VIDEFAPLDEEPIVVRIEHGGIRAGERRSPESRMRATMGASFPGRRRHRYIRVYWCMLSRGTLHLSRPEYWCYAELDAALAGLAIVGA